MSDYYTPTNAPATGSALSSATIRNELNLISAGFDKLLDLSSNPSKIPMINVGGTAMVAATVGTDYAAAPPGAYMLKSNGSGGFAEAVAGTDFQAVLVSGTNIKTINSTSLLGSGDIAFRSVNGTSVVGSGDISILSGIVYSRYTSNTTAADKSGIIADTSGGSWTLTLPATPASGTQIHVADGASWGTNNLTVARNGSTIESLAEDLTLDIAGAYVIFVYDGTTWNIYAQIGAYVGQPETSPPIVAYSLGAL